MCEVEWSRKALFELDFEERKGEEVSAYQGDDRIWASLQRWEFSTIGNRASDCKIFEGVDYLLFIYMSSVTGIE